MILQPLGSRIIVKRRRIGRYGSLYIPKNSQEARVCIGEVSMVGPDVDENLLKVGDMITFGRYAPMNIETGDLELYGLKKPDDSETDMLLLNAEDVLCIIVREKSELQ